MSKGRTAKIGKSSGWEAFLHLPRTDSKCKITSSADLPPAEVFPLFLLPYSPDDIGGGGSDVWPTRAYQPAAAPRPTLGLSPWSRRGI